MLSQPGKNAAPSTKPKEIRLEISDSTGVDITSTDADEKDDGIRVHKPNVSFIKSKEKTIRLTRTAYTYDEVEELYSQLPVEGKQKRKCPTWGSVIPAIEYARIYDFQNSLMSDVCSGISVACLHLPQGLAYGLLAGLTPISGVYTSIFSVLVYVVLGTVPHISMGTNAVLSLITAAMVEREADRYFQDNNITIDANNNATGHNSEDQDLCMAVKLGVAMTSTFVCGVILLLMGLFRMGFLTNYMPSSFVGGFTSAAALHIALSQMRHVFHIKVPVQAGFGKLVRTVHDVLHHLDEMNPPDTLVCLASACVLLILERCVNPAIKSKLGLALPSNLILVVMGTAVSHILDLRARWGVSVVGVVGRGVPLPKPPPLDLPLVTAVLYDSLTQAVIVFTMTISMAMLMAKMHNYELDSNRELVAYGACNLLSSFFPVQSSSVSPPRTMVLSSSGAHTTFNGVSTVIVLLASVTFVGGLLRDLPLATLAAMIIVAVLSVLLQIRHVPKIWRVSRTDMLVWSATWLSTALGDLQYGICVGVLMAALGFMVNNQYIKGELVVRSTREDLLVPGQDRAWTKHMDRIRIFYFPSQLFFANAESFKRQLYEMVFDPSKGQEPSDLESEADLTTGPGSNDIDFIILDCSAMTYLDIDGLNMLKSVVIRYHNVGVQVLLARCPHTTMRTLERGGFFELVPRSRVFHEVVDALSRETDVMLRLGKRSSMFLTPSLRRVSTANFLSKSVDTIY